MKTLHMGTLGFAIAICISTLASAHDGHNHGAYNTPNGASRSGYDYGDNNPYGSRNSCSPGRCACSANNTDFTPRISSSPALPAINRPTTTRPNSRLEADLNRLADDLRYETRGSRGQSVLFDDLSQLQKESRHFEDSVARRADLNHLREDAARVKSSLVQLNADMRREGRFPESERSLVAYAREFVGMVDRLGLTQRAPSYPSTAPNIAPRGNGLTPPIGTPRPLNQPSPTRQPLTQRIPQGMEGIGKLSEADQASALAQQMCPVTKQKLGLMGKPIRVTVDGRSLWVCCQGCVDAVKSNPGQYFRGL